MMGGGTALARRDECSDKVDHGTDNNGWLAIDYTRGGWRAKRL